MFYLLVQHYSHYSQIGHFTLENASNNDTAMTILVQLLEDGASLLLIPRSVGFAVFRILSTLAFSIPSTSTQILTSPIFRADGVTHINKTEYVAAVRRHTVGLDRDTLQVIHGSGQRRYNFHQTILTRNVGKSFISTGNGNTIALPPVQLLQDVRTRWDSSYFMINRLRALRQVCRDSRFEGNLGDDN
jgi:hypothetical protein